VDASGDTWDQTAPEWFIGQCIELFGVENIAQDDTFFDLGGDSLLALELLSRCESYGVSLDLVALFDATSISEFAYQGLRHESSGK
jgi:acyl carrier protein